MRIYVLLPERVKTPTTPLHLLHPASRVSVRPGLWMLARAEAFQDAITRGEHTVCIMDGTVQLIYTPTWNGRGERPQSRWAEERDQHGMWLYLERLSRRYAHVYLPPLGLTVHGTWPAKDVINHPVIPSVAVYQTHALAQLPRLDGPVGYQLVSAGYDSFTLSDFSFLNPGNDTRLVERGDATTWSHAYERAIDRYL